MKQCLMISGGPLDLSYAKEFLKQRTYDYIVAVDAGFQACLDLGIQPDLLVGDFDTFGRERIKEYMNHPSFNIDIHKPEKDETDTELAFWHIRNAGYTTTPFRAEFPAITDEIDVVTGTVCGESVAIKGRREPVKLVSE